ncbi:MAG: hypothetical protein LBV44_10480 [Methylobacillus sp.]|jgi:hypothetical protein|nr:hypothetical protein [Methylobacillus sp.]
MKTGIAVAIIGLTTFCGASAFAQSVAEQPPSHAISADLFASTDADHTEVYRTGVNLDYSNQGDEQFLGVRHEHAWYKPLGQQTRERDRVFLRYADKNEDWAWINQIGTDGHTALGSINIHNNAAFRQEYFIEREIVETPIGVDKGLYSTFAGAAIDLPLNERNTVTLVGGAQEFTGKNMRWHARGTYIYVVEPDWGFSLQLRTRYFHSTHPGEFDYYSPRYYLQVLPVAQIRRYYGGWRYMLAAGIGGQREAASEWQQSRFVTAEMSSPANRLGWFVKAAALYSNTPLNTGVYDYSQLVLSIGKRF